ncbi:MAG: EVE domain-containing protein [Gemmatimonadetes bacterium]|uniref:EVE domain-containing protein n=1 Tax=Candidatus Kutchimonas denitrificans TaxID=3056748 RepID=A0AAE4Z828_9BACT|nr:EVE domain-containing protein [Gemmatimonadota bacterium]NIR73896.1 EVE domain-containing protein [Candidatus Kutchimonas denitrificans]NIR99702.1 EVE domain-containing protein [Gemmatimonadota bacterium]NIT65287.1 EVE domain-containing protein [Gemmatimonadota bacterium]NIW73736.1 EVE domain-containing protein [Gemmatimonadota bacterium]
MGAKWLLKSEPDEYSFDDLEREGRAVWDGVRNAVALRNMRQVQAGDGAFFYHTGKERAIVGVARIESDPYPDPDADDEKIVVFEVSPVRRLARPVTLAEVKAADELDDWELVRLPRLSVMPVPERLWSRILEMSDG